MACEGKPMVYFSVPNFQLNLVLPHRGENPPKYCDYD